jgi:hypothetical protein
VELLVARACGAQRELLDAVAGERGMRVAVDEARNGTQTAPVELLDLAVERELAHQPDGRDPALVTEHVRVLEHVQLAELATAQRRTPPSGRDDLGQIADEQARHAAG